VGVQKATTASHFKGWCCCKPATQPPNPHPIYIPTRSCLISETLVLCSVSGEFGLFVVLQSPSPPQYVFWYHNERMINYDTSRGGVTVSTEPGPKTHSRLIINSATLADSGNYSCRASNTDPDFIQVFVSKGRINASLLHRDGEKSSIG